MVTVMIRFSSRSAYLLLVPQGMTLIRDSAYSGQALISFLRKMARSDYPLIWNSMFVYEVEFSSVIRGHVYDREELDKELNEYAVGTYLEARP